MSTKHETNAQGRSSYSSEDRRSLIAEYESSGLSQAAFCREWDLNPTTFSGWLRAERVEEPQMAFCEVEVAEAPTTPSAIRVRLPNQVEVIVPVGVSGGLGLILREAAGCWD